jgi:triosephosphate isomerase|tara:strand:+ start:143 stop:898 length:756 start_codon:yes stop_codon:yes gene_type:complete
MRKNIVAGNWKMNLNRLEGISLVEDVLSVLPNDNNTHIVLAPSFVYLHKVAKLCANTSKVVAAAQNCSANEKGAFTGEVSANMIASCNARYVILGHSERRVNFNETNEILKTKVGQAFTNNLKIIFCCGESLSQREGGVYFDCIRTNISESLFHLSAKEFKNIVIAYEPIWAIGTGVTASTGQAQEMHAFIRNLLFEQYGNEVALSTSIIYGGSCNPANAKELFASKDIDGGLIGGASLNSDDFIAITQSF